MKNIYFYQTALGIIGLAEQDNKITNLHFGTLPPAAAGYTVRETEILREARRQLDDYLLGRRKVFNLPLAPAGTGFMLRVWRALADIPYGETRSYKDIAQAIGHPRAARAVGQANNKNPLPVFIPCHRVIGTNGRLVGYGGGLEIKQRLLALENGREIFNPSGAVGEIGGEIKIC